MTLKTRPAVPSLVLFIRHVSPGPMCQPLPSLIDRQLNNLSRSINDPNTSVSEHTLPAGLLDTGSEGTAVSLQPSREEDILHIFMPFPLPLRCTERGCHQSFKAKDWTAVKQSLKRHLKNIHAITINAEELSCLRCGEILCKKAKSHLCLDNGMWTRDDPDLCFAGARNLSIQQF